MRDFFLLFGAQAAGYFLITANQRALVFGLYGWTGITDLAYTFLAFSVIRKVAKSESNWARAGYMLGSVCGSLLGILATKHTYGH